MKKERVSQFTQLNDQLANDQFFNIKFYLKLANENYVDMILA